MIIMGRTFHLTPGILVLFITLAFLLVFSSCIFGRKGRKCDCPTWSYEIPASEDPLWMMQPAFKETLARYVPVEALDEVASLIKQHQIRIKVRRGRLSKLGDFQACHKWQPASDYP
jgi:hypothetical protein